MPHLTIYNSQLYGGPDGELGAAMRYLSQRYSNTNRKVAGVLTDIGTEELAHTEMICAIVHQLTKNLNAKELEEQGFAPYYIDHTIGIWPQAASGEPWSATSIQSTGDPLADMHEDMAAEQKACLLYTSGEIAIVMVNGDNATIKRLLKYEDGIRLMPTNPAYEPLYFTNDEILEKPVKVIGKVIENRQKY